MPGLIKRGWRSVITSPTWAYSLSEVKLGNNDAIELTLMHNAFITECLDYAVRNDVSGVWGGTTTRERMMMTLDGML